ncbi:MAG: hypothetical protein OXG68_09205 [Chloroflexi bacterium]|nr:hypothetical protein [Chloroflexota bacterium]
MASFDDVLALGQRQFDWREERLSDAPRCAEADDIALLMYRVTSDDALTWALLAAGADKEDIPQIMSTRAGIGRLNTMLAEIADAAHDGG